MSLAEHRVKSIRFWVTLAAVVAAAGFSAATLLDSFAKESDLQRVENALHEHIAVENGRVSALESTSRNLEEDFHVVEQQLWNIADRVHADKVPEPDHRQSTHASTQGERP